MAVPHHSVVSVLVLGAPDAARLEQIAAALPADAELIVGRDAATIDRDRVVSVEAPAGSRGTFLRAAASAASGSVCVALDVHAVPRAGFAAPLVTAVAERGGLAAPVLETHGGEVWGYRVEADGSLWPRSAPDDGLLGALALDCLAAPTDFFRSLPDPSAGDGLYEVQLAAFAGGRLCVADAARVARGARGPAVTVAICTHDRADEVGPCLDLLAATGALTDGCEVVVVDNGSTDATAEVVRDRIRRHGGAIRLLHESRPGLSFARNAALEAARTDVVAFLDDDARPAPGWLEHLRAAFADPEVAVVGGPIHALWPAGRPAGWPGRDLEPYFTILWHGDTPADVAVGDFYGANWSCRRAPARAAGGFDERFGANRQGGLTSEETDLARRLAAAGAGVQRWAPGAAVGHRVDPARLDESWLVQRAFRQGTSAPWAQGGEPDPALAPVASAQAALELAALVPLFGIVGVSGALGAIAAAPEALATRVRAAYLLGSAAGWGWVAGARELAVGAGHLRLTEPEAHGFSERPRVAPWAGGEAADGLNLLLIADELPLWDRASGGLRLFEIVRLLRAAGHQVTYLARDLARSHDPAPYVDRLVELGVEVIAGDAQRLREHHGGGPGGSTLDVAALLSTRRWDAVYVYFHHVAAQYWPLVRRYAPDARLVVDSVDIHFLRERREAELAASPDLLARAERTRAAELEAYRAADAVVVVTDADADALRQEDPEIATCVIPNIHELPDAVASFDERRDLVFVGGFCHQPNVDAVLWFASAVWPAVAAALPDARLQIVGDAPPPAVQALASERVVVTGYVPETRPYLERSRVSIAPLRYGAGMKGKVGEALAAGLPVVATSIAAEGFGLASGRELLVADEAAAFAEAVVSLYDDEARWTSLSHAGRTFMERFGPKAVAAAVESAVAPVELDARGTVVVGFADELLADPEPLRAYIRSVGADDPATLVLVTRETEVGPLSDLVAALDDDPASLSPDLLALSPPRLARVLARRAAATCGRGARRGYETLPVVDGANVRAALGLPVAA